MYIHFVSMFPLPLTLNPLSNLHAITTPAQHNYVLELLDKGQSSHAISTTTGISVASISNICSKYYSTLSKSVGGHPCFHLLIPNMLSTSALLRKLKMPLRLPKHDQHILICEDSTMSTQEHWDEGCNQAKTTFPLQKA